MALTSLLGAFKSKTVWAAFAIALLSWLQPIINSAGLNAQQTAEIGTVIGAAMIWLRSITTVPLSAK